jgi:chaperonin GroEL
VDEAGDGTTTATLLTHAIFAAGCQAIDDGAEPVQLVHGIELATRAVVGSYDAKARKFQGGILEKFAVPCSPELAYSAARISANSDDAIAKVVSEAVLMCGVDGALTIGDSYSQDHVLEIADGMQIKAGMAHPYFITDLKRNACAYDNVTVLLIDRRISTNAETQNILTKAIAAAKANGRAFSLLILCNEIDNEALAHILHNKIENHIPVVVVRTPLWGDARRDLLEDIALITHAKRIESPAGKAYELLGTKDFGHAARVVVDAGKTIITADSVSEEERESDIAPYLARLQSIVSDQNLRPDQIDAAKGRLAALTGGVAVIKVGGTSAQAVHETKFRVEDAIHATRAAVADGVVPGGGSALLFAIAHDHPLGKGSSHSVDLGYQILLDAMMKPLAQIAENGGRDGFAIIKKVYDNGLPTIDKDEIPRNGFDAANGFFVDDMIGSGIVDPLRVVRAALNAAASAACVLLKCECVLAHDAANTPAELPAR